MKTSEMIAYLEEHPEAKFRLNDKEFDEVDFITVDENGYLEFRVEGISGRQPINGNLGINDDWQLVRETVPAWEAIKAWMMART